VMRMKKVMLMIAHLEAPRGNMKERKKAMARTVHSINCIITIVALFVYMKWNVHREDMLSWLHVYLV